MPHRFPFMSRRAGLAALAIAFGLVSFPVETVSQAGPISMLPGTWRGSGTLSIVERARERVVCRVTYGLTGGKLLQELDCAGTDYRINATGDFSVSGDGLSGRWRETTLNLSGSATGRTSGDRIFVRIDSSTFQARMTIQVASASAHTVDIQQFDAGTGRYSPMASISFRR